MSYPAATQTPVYRRSRRVATYKTWTNAGEETRGTLVVELRVDRETFPSDAAWTPHTVEHDAIADYLDIGLVGHKRRGKTDEGGGQCVDDLTAPDTRPVAAYTMADLAELAGLWDRWHLNAMRAGCAHQKRYDEAEPLALAAGFEQYGRGDVYAWQRDQGPCPYGYAYGAAWLVERVPADVVARLVDLMEQDPESVEQAGPYGGPTAARAAVDLARELTPATVQ